ncbi:auxin response factor 17 isoform X2 [Gastrolobium bilobum]|uniref:auxin response factor 17 isoform X2 n=1 Tax=Gastrolobium bilobum TaxID=150636 RepID=UPI002AAFDD5E|nr:auxin response factor 17 isoform X2 [Gastrolobium bilobum]XP_061365334.1 auxin response factor 17 isoform X2 [Gastrolobium bilobum]
MTGQLPPQPRRLDPKIWRACAGASVQIPTLHSRVYYFPQGHIDQASSPPNNLSPLLLSRPFILCRISAVQFLADSITDEVFAKLLLHPLTDYSVAPPRLLPPPPPSDDDDKVVSFAKILTPSDANNGGGFSVPRFCADSIFPPLDFDADPPVQNLSVTDVHGVAWEFRHIYRGTPRRHLLTTGWSKFVNSKKLVAGDSVVFMKNPRKEMFVGIRRATRFSSCDGARWSFQVGGVRNRAEEKPQEEEVKKDGFSRNGKGKLSAKAVAEAAELAAQNLPFEVVYYPRTGWSDFVVKAEIVDEAMSVVWTPGMRVKMAMETDDSSRMTWFQGTVSSVSVPDNGHWRGSPWRMLQVTWDEPEVLQNAKWVSPWQVELVAATPPLHTPFPPTKKFRAAQGPVVLTDGEGDPFSMTGFTNSTMRHLNQTLLSYGTFPAGMQGARHDLFSASNFPNFSVDNSRLCMGNSFGNNTVPRLKSLSTDLNVGSFQSDDLSPDSQHSSLHSFGTEFVRNHSCNSTKSGSVSFQLFGAVIHAEQPVESGSHGTGCTEDDSSKGCNETEGIDNPLDDSLTYSKLLDRLDDQCQRASTVEACYL